jgi:hypothetical protein
MLTQGYKSNSSSSNLFVFFESFVYTLFSTTKEIRAWISWCTVAGEITNGLLFPMMVVDDTKAMMAVYRSCVTASLLILLTVGGRNDEHFIPPELLIG